MPDSLLNRFSGLAVALFGAILLWGIIPIHVETVEYGWVRPDTLPRICGWGLIVLGLWQSVLPGGSVDLNLSEALIVLVTAGLSAAAIWGLGAFGFLYTAPAFVAAIIALIGERRWPWVVVTVIGAPLIIWLIVDLLLGRPLP